MHIGIAHHKSLLENQVVQMCTLPCNTLLQSAVRHEVETITPDLLRRVMDNFTVRLQQCRIVKEGAHLDDLIFNK
jgi:hypothetical protein